MKRNRTMSVHGFEINEAQIGVCVERMKQGLFRQGDIRETALIAHISDHVASQFADRLIRKLRLERKIQLSNKYPYATWEWISH